MAETVKKYLDQEGLAYFIEKLVAGEVKGKGLSTNDFTNELLTKLNSTATTAGLNQLTQDVNELKALIEADSDGAINKFNEIVTFLAGISDTKTLDGLLGDISTQIAGKVSPSDLPSELPNPEALVLKLNGNTVEGTGQFTYDGSAAKTVNITAASVGAMTSAQLKAATFAAGKFAAKSYTPTAAATINVPTNTSHLTNDSGYITQGDINAITNTEIDALIAVGA